MMFYIFFIVLSMVAIYIIFRQWKRYVLSSNGYYKNAGQDIIVWCDKSETEIINKLKKKEESDTLYYDFFAEDNTYYLRVTGICRYMQKSCFSALFMLSCIPDEKGTYIVASVATSIGRICSSAFEPELYEFFAKKLGCIPKERVDITT